MKKLTFVLSVFLLSSCLIADPFFTLEVALTVPVEAQGETFPQELVFDFGNFSGARRTFVLCEPSAVPIQVDFSLELLGCAKETPARAWLTPFTPAPGEVVVCGEQPGLSEGAITASASLEPLETDPSAEQALFVGESAEVCKAINAEVALTLSL